MEIPFFIFPAVLILVGEDLFPNAEFSWLGLGALGTLGTLIAGVPAPFFGSLADKYRRSLLMTISLALGAAGALVVGVFGGSFFGLGVGIFLMGLGVSLYHPPGLSWVSSSFENTQKGAQNSYNRILAVHSIGGTIGSALGPLSVYLLIDTINWRQIYLLWSIPLALLAIGFWIFIGRREAGFNATSNAVFHPKVQQMIEPPSSPTLRRSYATLLTLFAFIFAMSLVRGMISFILAPFLTEEKGFEISQAAFFVGVSTLIGAIGQLAVGALGDKYGEKAILSSVAALQAVFLVGIYTVRGEWALLGFYVLLGLSTAMFWPATQSLIAKNSKQRGKAFGWFILVGNVVGGLGPSIDGIIISIDFNGYSMIFGFAILFALCASVSMLLLKTLNITTNATGNA